MAVPSLADWRQQILQGIKAPVTPSNIKFINAWAQAEGGGATNNPFNTTQPMPGATPYNTLDSGGHVWKYATPQQGIQATIQTLKGPIGNYAPIIAALRQGSDPMAAAKAVAGSQWGTGSGVERVLGGTPPSQLMGGSNASSLPAAPPGPSVPTGPALPVSGPPVPPLPAVPKFTQLPDFSTAITSSLGKSPEAMTQAIVNASQRSEQAIWKQVQQAAHAPAGPQGPVTTPAAQAARPPKMTIPVGEGQTVEVESRGVTPKDMQAAKLACHFIGTPYSWGGGGPGGPSYGIEQGAHTKGFDCSGLLQFVWAKQGVTIGGDTYSQWDQGKSVGKTSLRAGDAVFFHPSSRGPEHVGMYLGGGKFIEAPHTGATVRISKLAGRDDYMGARRYG